MHGEQTAVLSLKNEKERGARLVKGLVPKVVPIGKERELNVEFFF